jgi:hypothetical protein
MKKTNEKLMKQKKLLMPEGKELTVFAPDDSKMKLVRINAVTEIEVPIEMDETEARDHFRHKIENQLRLSFRKRN